VSFTFLHFPLPLASPMNLPVGCFLLHCCWNLVSGGPTRSEPDTQATTVNLVPSTAGSLLYCALQKQKNDCDAHVPHAAADYAAFHAEAVQAWMN
jgi:hypothetical protein